MDHRGCDDTQVPMLKDGRAHVQGYVVPLKRWQALPALGVVRTEDPACHLQGRGGTVDRDRGLAAQ